MANSSVVPSCGVWMLALLVLGSLLGALAEPQAGGDWNALSGMWGKRASSDWNRLSSMWGKRAPYGPYQQICPPEGKYDKDQGKKRRLVECPHRKHYPGECGGWHLKRAGGRC
ncbi:hypothetical protein HPB49_003324 [Dermacentor silvarum]|uniref:Uncharacterized protein n=1 Tax=Dermacentor silvarum TaxID=543639 RepID=A0ACB8CUZ5_DERSI|nr:hypothetical protein HPB49_003324 [Dermacentor silvarum]